MDKMDHANASGRSLAENRTDTDDQISSSSNLNMAAKEKGRRTEKQKPDPHKKKAVFLDLDGTFWNREVIPASAKEAVKKARENGNLVFVNTGRTADNIPQFLWDMDLDGYLLATGMDLYRGQNNFRKYTMDEERVRKIERYLKEHGCGYSLQEERVNYDDPKFAFRRMVFFEKENRREWMNRVNLDGVQIHPRDQIMKVNFDTETPFDLQPLLEKENLDVLFYVNKHNPLNGFGSAYRGELTDASHNKALAMHEILDGIEENYQLMAIGDSENDIPMFEEADIAVCMGNGTEAAKAKADWITDQIDNDGLYKAFAHYRLI